MTLAPIILVLAVFAVLILGYPVAISLAGTALIAAVIGIFFGTFDPAFLSTREQNFWNYLEPNPGCRPTFRFNGRHIGED